MNIKRKMVGIYLSDEEHAMLQEQASDADQTKSAYVRSLLRRADKECDIRIPRKHRPAKYAQ